MPGRSLNSIITTRPHRAAHARRADAGVHRLAWFADGDFCFIVVGSAKHGRLLVHDDGFELLALDVCVVRGHHDGIVTILLVQYFEETCAFGERWQRVLRSN